jgi:streptomycin 6-kinase
MVASGTGGCSLVEVPATFLAMPRWRYGGKEWLAALPALVAAQCRRWQLDIDGPPMHGSNALVVPVRRGHDPMALRLTPPEDDVDAEVTALRFWNGRGTVILYDADLAHGATLLERLDGSRSLNDLPLAEAVPLIATMMRRLAVPTTAEGVLSTTDVAKGRLADLERAWSRHDRPFHERVLDQALLSAEYLTTTTSDLAVNADLHYQQILPATREPWLTVDPRLMRGDIEFDLARILWSRLDEMTDADVHHHVQTVIDHAGLEADRAHHWVLFRSVDYWLWGLDHGLTEDPIRCARIVTLLM